LSKKQIQQTNRVSFERAFPAQMMAIDGTWRRSCAMKAISETDALLHVEASIQGLALKEFFLVLSSTGLAYRRCELVKINGEELEVSFLHRKSKGRPAYSDTE
jgi:hypothetical protein